MSAPAAAALPPQVAAGAPPLAAAGAVESPVAPPAPRCDNCGAGVPGRYCGNCGQRHSGPEVAQINTAADSLPQAARPGETAQQRASRECGMIDYDGPWHATLRPAMQRACLKIRADNARWLTAAFRHNLPRTMFVFLPLLAGLMMLVYWRPRHYYVEHLLLLLHNHAFAFVVLPLAWGLSALVPPASGWVDLALCVYLAWYMYRSMRTVYGQGPGLTLAKLTALSFFYFVFGMVMFVLNFAYSALTLD